MLLIKYCQGKIGMSNQQQDRDVLLCSCDATGAQIFECLRDCLFLSFVGLPESATDRYANHYHGLTRYLLEHSMSANCAELNKINNPITMKLATEYNEVF